MIDRDHRGQDRPEGERRDVVDEALALRAARTGSAVIAGVSSMIRKIATPARIARTVDARAIAADVGEDPVTGAALPAARRGEDLAGPGSSCRCGLPC